MELQPLKIRFYPKMKAKDSDDCVLYMRMVLSGRRVDLSLNYALKRDAWDDKEQTLRSKNPDRGFVLNLSNKYRQQAMEVYQQLIQRGMACDVNVIRHKIAGDSKNDMSLEPTLLKLFKSVIDRKKKLTGQQNTEATIQKYGRCKNHLALFIKQYYNVDDLKFNQLNLQFIEDFELFLKTDGKCCNNTTMKHIQTFKTIYKTAAAHGYTDKDPFQKYKIRMEEVVRDYLNEKEIQTLIEQKLPENKLLNVRDLFIFSCFTGLAYIDLKNLSAKHIQQENGRYWIRTRRQKTNVKTNVPLLEIPMRIITEHCPDFENENAEEKIFKWKCRRL